MYRYFEGNLSFVKLQLRLVNWYGRRVSSKKLDYAMELVERSAWVPWLYQDLLGTWSSIWWSKSNIFQCSSRILYRQECYASRPTQRHQSDVWRSHFQKAWPTTCRVQIFTWKLASRPTSWEEDESFLLLLY